MQKFDLDLPKMWEKVFTICEKADRAYFITSHGERIDLIKISEQEMDRRLQEELTGHYVGFPFMFTESKRVWPNPDNAQPVKVIFEEDII